MFVKSGFYVGDGGPGGSVTGLGFQPKAVIINTGLSNMFGTGFTTTYSLVAFGTSLATGILSLDADGFTYGAFLDSLGTTYWYVAFGGTDVAAGEYSGTGADNVAVNVGFQPDLIFIGHTDATIRSGFTWMMESPGDVMRDMGGFSVPQTDYIQGVSGSSFTIGTQANKVGSKYGWVAFRADDNYVKHAQYNGNATNPTVFNPGCAADIQFVWIKTNRAATNFGAAARTTQMAVGSSVPYPNAYQAGNIINNSTTTFTLDDSLRVNSAATTYVYYAFSSEPPPGLDDTPLTLAPIPVGFGGGQLNFSSYTKYKSLRAATQVYNNLLLSP